MSILKSLFFGSEGSYNIFGISAKFEKEFYEPVPNLAGAGLISKLASQCISSNVFRWITQGYSHVFVHEMSHALMRKVLTGQNSEVNIFTGPCIGMNQGPRFSANTSDWKETVIEAAGPMGNTAFCICKLIAATSLKSYLSWPVALALGSGAVIWISGELLYACISASKRDRGDFGQIARRGNHHLALASTALISECALGIFAALKLAA